MSLHWKAYAYIGKLCKLNLLQNYSFKETDMFSMFL